MSNEEGRGRRAIHLASIPFWNRQERRLRAFWRLLGVFVLVGLGTVLVGFAVSALSIGSVLFAVVGTAGTGVEGTLDRTLRFVVTALGAVLGVWVGGRLLDRRFFRSFGFAFDRGWWFDFGFGLALGAFLMTGVFLTEIALGWVEITGVIENEAGTAVGVSLLGTCVLFVAVGIYEELLFRGYLLRNVAEGLSGVSVLTPRRAIVLATIVAALAFGAVHASNPNATPSSTLTVAFAGVFLATGYLLTGELAIPIGLHITWNLFEGTVFGFPVSGTTLGASVVSISQRGPPALTGGEFGPEAGLIGLGAMVAGTALTVGWVRVRKRSRGIEESIAEPTLAWRS